MTVLSVILPVYNGREFLDEAINSVLSQEFPDLELILVDDGSTDTSGRICDEYAARHDRVTALHTANRGLSAARNCGLDAARGEWVSFIDADDALRPGALKMLMELALHSEDTDMAVGGFFFEKEGLSTMTPPCHVRFMHPVSLIEETLYQTGAVHAAWGKIYRRSLFDKVRFTEGLYYEDLDFFYRYCLQCRSVAVTSSQLYFYRQHQASIVHTWNERRLDVLRVTEKIEAFMTANYPVLVPAARDRRLSANFNIFINASAAGRDDIADKCWELIRAYRMGSLTDPHVRRKNKIGILASLFGKRIFKYISLWAGM